jgi:RNA polymerase-binding transcription factor DksA
VGDEKARNGIESFLPAEREKRKLLAIDGALEKLRKGTCGICEECGESITPRRMTVPLTKLCLNCQNDREKEEWGGFFLSVMLQEEKERHDMEMVDPLLIFIRRTPINFIKLFI